MNAMRSTYHGVFVRAMLDALDEMDRKAAEKKQKEADAVEGVADEPAEQED